MSVADPEAGQRLADGINAKDINSQEISSNIQSNKGETEKTSQNLSSNKTEENETINSGTGSDIEGLVRNAAKKWPKSKVKVTGRARTVRRQAELMAEQARNSGLHPPYKVRPHTKEMTKWVKDYPKASYEETVTEFEGIIHRALDNGAVVSEHLSDNARDVHIPESNKEEIRQFFQDSGLRVLDEESKKRPASLAP